MTQKNPIRHSKLHNPAVKSQIFALFTFVNFIDKRDCWSHLAINGAMFQLTKVDFLIIYGNLESVQKFDKVC